MNNLIVEVVNDHVHNEAYFVVHVFLSDICDRLLELFAPLLLDVKGLALVLLRFQVPVEESLQLLALVLLPQPLLLD